jgi:hypothetical protein
MQNEPISRLVLEQWALGMLPPERTHELDVLADLDPELRQRVERVRMEIAAAQIDLPKLSLPETLTETQPSWWSRLWMPVGLGLALAVAVLIALPAVLAPEETVVFRGALDLEIVRVRAGDAVPQTALIQAREGDRLQYAAISPVDGFLYVFDVQDNGDVSQWQVTEVRPMQRVEGAAILDDYPGGERLFFVLSPEPLGEGVFEDAIHDVWQSPLVDLDVVPGLPVSTQRSVLLVKERL